MTDAWDDILVTPDGGAGPLPVLSEEGGNKGTCPDCQKVLTITAAGNLRSHKCINDVQTSSPAKGAGKNSKLRTPKQVRKLAVAGIASAVEYVTAETLARTVPCPVEVAKRPADLGDNADIMIGPFLDLIWPRMPKGAQKAISSLAEETDLILAALAWAEWGKNLKAFTDAVRAAREDTHHGTVPGQADQGGGVLGLVPFAPDTPGSAAL